jgi:hypothetical protein
MEGVSLLGLVGGAASTALGVPNRRWGRTSSPSYTLVVGGFDFEGKW